MPDLIDSPGEYVTRAGYKVVIREINPPSTSTFNCKGTRYKPDALGRMRPRYSVWRSNGRHLLLTESLMDIVGKWENPDA